MHWPDCQRTDDAHDKGHHNGEQGGTIADAFAVRCGHKLSPKVGVVGEVDGGDCEKPARDMQGTREVVARLCKVDVKMRESFFHTTITITPIDSRPRRNRGLARRESIACELFLFLSLGALVVCRASLRELVPLSPSSRYASPKT